MECMEARALKPSLCGELPARATQQVGFDDLWCLNGNGVASGEDFSVECFLDLSSGFEDGFVEEEEEEEEEEEKDSLSVSSSHEDNNSNSCSLSSDSLLTSELAVPDDDIAGLEWVSHFVDDSLSELSLLFPAGKVKTENKPKPLSTFEPLGPVLVKRSFFSSPVPVKARSKRTRQGTTGGVWPLGSLPLTETSTSSSSSSLGFTSSPCVLLTHAIQHIYGEPREKKQKRKPEAPARGLSGANPFQRRCSHCQVQKTPQWRTGPLGAKTLCNACGVRFKSGRLFPEYRPACSPTFSSDIHSNSHRKVLEMRKRKEVAGQEPSLTEMVPSF